MQHLEISQRSTGTDVEKALQKLLQAHRKAISSKWLDLVLRTYPSESSSFMKNEPDPFTNPVGQAFSRMIEPVLCHLIDGDDGEEQRTALEEVLQIRAIQKFKPSDAAGIFILLKKVVRTELKVRKLEASLLCDLLEFESGVDSLSLQAFDIHQIYRDRIYDIKANSLRRRSERIVEKLNERLLERQQAPVSDEAEGSHGNKERGDTR